MAVNEAMKAAKGKVRCTARLPGARKPRAAYLSRPTRATEVADAKKAGEAINMNGFNLPNGQQPFDPLTAKPAR